MREPVGTHRRLARAPGAPSPSTPAVKSTPSAEKVTLVPSEDHANSRPAPGWPSPPATATGDRLLRHAHRSARVGPWARTTPPVEKSAALAS